MTEQAGIVSERRLKLLKAMFEARKEMKTVAMSGHNKFDGYDYSTNADFVTCIESPCEKHGLLITHEVVEDTALESRKNHKGFTEQVRRVKVRSTCTLIENGEAMWAEFACEGMDPRDKANLKANTGAKKYAISNLFNLKTGIDPEDSEDGRNSKAPPQQGSNQQRRQQSQPPSGRSQSASSAPPTVTAPKGWPDTDVTNLCNWIKQLAESGTAFKVAWGMLKNNRALYQDAKDWPIVFKSFTDRLRLLLTQETMTKASLGESTIAEIAAEAERIKGEQAFKDETAPAEETQEPAGTESTDEQETTG